MKRIFTLFIVAANAAFAWCADEATLVINELMQSNVETLMDDIKEFPDSWVELYNPTDAAINLKDYKIATKDKEKKAWQLPERLFPPKAMSLSTVTRKVKRTTVFMLISVWSQARMAIFTCSRAARLLINWKEWLRCQLPM